MMGDNLEYSAKGKKSSFEDPGSEEISVLLLYDVTALLQWRQLQRRAYKCQNQNANPMHLIRGWLFDGHHLSISKDVALIKVEEG